jgi:hypothetical protein
MCACTPWHGFNQPKTHFMVAKLLITWGHLVQPIVQFWICWLRQKPW